MSFRSVAIIIAVLFGLGHPAFAQDAQFGTEFDVLPYATGGWYASGWWGRDHVRMSGDDQARVGSRIDEPPKGLAEASIKLGLRF